MFSTRMIKTPELLQEILEVISNNATYRHAYLGNNGEMCVLGGLATHASIELPPSWANGRAIGSYALTKFRRDLSNRYALTDDEMVQLQQINDTYKQIEDRRFKLRQLVRRFWGLTSE